MITIKLSGIFTPSWIFIMAVIRSMNMWLYCKKPVINVTMNFISALRKSYQHQLALSYYTTSAGLNQCTAEKSKTSETGTENNESKNEELSCREKELMTENEKLLEDVRALDDKYKRALADNENVRNRMRREVSDAKQYGIQNFVKDLLEVADVLGKATESVPKDAVESNSHLKSLYEGLQMTEAQLQSVFKRYGVTQINPVGEKFNPNHHEALFELEDASKEPGTVGIVTKIGYKLHERVVRPAMVGVIKASR